MNTKWYIASTLALVFFALLFTSVKPLFSMKMPEGNGLASVNIITKPFFQSELVDGENYKSKNFRTPVRKWDVFDPLVLSEAVLIQSLDDGFPFLSYNTYKSWPMASLTKLLTAVAIFEDIGANEKIPISSAAVETEGESGNLRSGEVYTARELLQIMLLASSNDVAAAFEEYFGGKEKFAEILNSKASKMGMTGTVVYDGSGLSNSNVSSASDLSKLIKYIAEKTPEILSWTRLQNIIVQPTNDTTSKQISNINPISSGQDFLGGKTGTSPAAGENIISIFSFENRRVVVIILGSPNRANEISSLLSWVKKAYESR